MKLVNFISIIIIKITSSKSIEVSVPCTKFGSTNWSGSSILGTLTLFKEKDEVLESPRRPLKRSQAKEL